MSASLVASGSGVPPAAETRINPDAPGSNTMVLSGAQLPPWPSVGTSHTVTGVPPRTDTRFKRSSAKNAMDSPSGEKNG